jgi:hypothetical protein
MTDDPRQMLEELKARLRKFNADDLLQAIQTAQEERVTYTEKVNIDGKSVTVTKGRSRTPEEQYLAASRLIYQRLAHPAMVRNIERTFGGTPIYIERDRPSEEGEESPGEGSRPRTLSNRLDTEGVKGFIDGSEYFTNLFHAEWLFWHLSESNEDE